MTKHDSIPQPPSSGELWRCDDCGLRFMMPLRRDEDDFSCPACESNVTAYVQVVHYEKAVMMSYDNRLVPINSHGMREVVDEATMFKKECQFLREELARLRTAMVHALEGKS